MASLKIARIDNLARWRASVPIRYRMLNKQTVMIDSKVYLVSARTCSEARARAKAAHGIPRKGRLPLDTIVTRCEALH